MSTDSVGFIGLGNMGQPLSGHIARNGFEMQVFDIAGTQARAPQGVRIAGGNAALARVIEGTLTSMSAGPAELLDRVQPLLQCYSRIVYRVGDEPGQGQRMKVVNNALCMAHYVIVSEALSYGEHGGLDMATMLEVINASSGQNFTTSVSFPNYVLTGSYDSGADAAIIEKDLSLFIAGASEAQTPAQTIGAAYRIIKAFKDTDPSQDAMRIYPFVKDKAGST